MAVMKYVYIVLAVVAGLSVFFAAFKSKRPLRTLAASAFTGLAALAVVAATGYITQVSVPINLWSVLCAAGAGLPGVVLMLTMKIVWNI
ncbi:MAG: pro-sigmaK processing inhibitor BofA family protein [Oscillospiraceae bacterium]|jgi:pro-sigmaK processing inhibitor BofA|nr:pro-sigmaK processing inhibitor BofA family protein [Oscillospiraceae bacterium]